MTALTACVEHPRRASAHRACPLGESEFGMYVLGAACAAGAAPRGGSGDVGDAGDGGGATIFDRATIKAEVIAAT